MRRLGPVLAIGVWVAGGVVLATASAAFAAVDRDCDGLPDAFEATALYGGTRHSDALDSDSDGDGLPDGLEAGVSIVPDPASCPDVRVDACPASTTDPTLADSDGDGLLDGFEDANGNGCVDGAAAGVAAESDPSNPGDASSVALLACGPTALAPPASHVQIADDLQLALDPAVSEIHELASGGADRGYLFRDAAHGVAGFALSKPPSGATASAEETAARALFDAVGAISAPTLQALSTWDGVPAVAASYAWGSASDLGPKLDQVVGGLLGNPSDLTGLFGTPLGLAGPHELRVGYVRRSDQQAVVLAAAAPASGFGAAAEARLDDAATDLPLARALDRLIPRCERFLSGPPPEVDFLWIIQNSASMADDQAALAAAAQAMTDRLAAAHVDWRMAVAYTDLYLAPSANDVCSGAPGPGRRRICPFTSDPTLFRNGSAQCAYARPGTCGSGSERGFDAAQRAIAAFLSGSGCEPVPGASCSLRSGAQLVLVFVTDTGEQTLDATPPPGQPDNSVASWAAYLGDYDPATAGAQRAQVDGILCPLRPQPGDLVGPCSDDDVTSSHYDRYSQLIAALGGVEGSIAASDQPLLPATVARIAAQASPGLTLARAPLASTLRVALETSGGPTAVPRDPLDGFAYLASLGAISLRGSFAPDAAGREAAVSSYAFTRPVPEPGAASAAGAALGALGIRCRRKGGATRSPASPTRA